MSAALTVLAVPPVTLPTSSAAGTDTSGPGAATAVAWLVGELAAAGRATGRGAARAGPGPGGRNERLRIARELHDMVAHSIGIIAIQAGAGSRVIDTQPERGAEGADRHRDHQPGDAGWAAAHARGAAPGRAGRGDATAAPLAPRPGWPTSTAGRRHRGAGVRVEVQLAGQRRPLPAEIELSAFRIIQEAVTNVVRHAGTARLPGDGRLPRRRVAIEVVDDGRGGAGTARARGFGMVGMRERVGLLPGQFTRRGPRLRGRLPASDRPGCPARCRGRPAAR